MNVSVSSGHVSLRINILIGSSEPTSGSVQKLPEPAAGLVQSAAGLLVPSGEAGSAEPPAEPAEPAEPASVSERAGPVRSGPVRSDPQLQTHTDV